MKKITVLFILCLLALSSFSVEKRDVLQNEAKTIGLEKVLAVNFQELNFPTYNNRTFWNNLPAQLKAQYIEDAEKSLDYTWPSVKATDYIEIIRSGDRRQGAYGQLPAKHL